MIYINVHLLAILPLLLFTVATAVRYSFHNSTLEKVTDEFVKSRLNEDFLFSYIMETTVLASLNGIILAELSGSFGGGIAFLMSGLFLGLTTMTLFKNGYNDLSEYLMAVMGLLFLYEFIYFLAAGTYARIFGMILIGWQIAVIWYFGFIGACIGLFVFYLWFTNRGAQA